MGAMAEAGTGSNIDSTSLAAGQRAKDIRTKDALDTLNMLYSEQGRGLLENASGSATDALNFAQANDIVAGRSESTLGTMANIENTGKQTDATIGMMDAEVSGNIPYETMLRTNPYINFDDQGKPQLIDEDKDYAAALRQLEAVGLGNSQEANDLRFARAFKTINLPEYRQYGSEAPSPVQKTTASLEAEEAQKQFTQSLAYEKQAQKINQLLAAWEVAVNAKDNTKAEQIWAQLKQYGF